MQQLPVLDVILNGRKATALIDTGCSRSIVAAGKARKEQWVEEERIIMLSREEIWCFRSNRVSVEVIDKKLDIDCLVANIVPGFDILLGTDAVDQLGAIRISANGQVMSCSDVNCGGMLAISATELVIKDVDFDAVFADRIWTVK